MPDEVWIVVEQQSTEDGTQYEEVVAVYTTEQTANQHVDRHGPGLSTQRHDLLRNLRGY